MQYIENYRKGSGKNCRKRAKTPPKIAAKLAKKPQKTVIKRRKNRKKNCVSSLTIRQNFIP